MHISISALSKPLGRITILLLISTLIYPPLRAQSTGNLITQQTQIEHMSTTQCGHFTRDILYNLCENKWLKDAQTKELKNLEPQHRKVHVKRLQSTNST
jgi:hypothetical protein